MVESDIQVKTDSYLQVNFNNTIVKNSRVTLFNALTPCFTLLGEHGGCPILSTRDPACSQRLLFLGL